MSILNNPKFKVLNKKGEPIVGAKMYIYAAGTDNKEFFFSDNLLRIPLTNPVLTDEYGDFPVCYTENKNYKIVIKDNKDNLLYTLDNINFFSTLEDVISQQEDGSVLIKNKNYERDIIFNISNYDNPDGVDVLYINSSTGEIKTQEGYEDLVSDKNTLITKGFIEKYPSLPLDYIARLPVTYTNTTITVGAGCCKTNDGKEDIRLNDSLTTSFEEETIYKFTADGSITFPTDTTTRLLVVAGGGAGGNSELNNLPLRGERLYQAGFGGAGGVIEKEDYVFPTDTYEVKVGAGGDIMNRNGEDSSIGSLVAFGGGAGGILTANDNHIAEVNGASGGSGGGAGGFYTGAQYYSRTSGTAGKTIDAEQGEDGNAKNAGQKALKTDISGKMEIFGSANSTSSVVEAHTGNGGRAASVSNNSSVLVESTNGASGVVIVRTAKNASITTTGTVEATDVTPLTASSTKYLFITNIPSLVLSANSTGSDLPSLGYTSYRRLGTVTIDASSHISGFTRNVDNLPWA